MMTHPLSAPNYTAKESRDWDIGTIVWSSAVLETCIAIMPKSIQEVNHKEVVAASS